MSEELIKNTFEQWIYIDSNDYIGKNIKKYGLYDSYSIYFIRSLLKKITSPIVMDIGANIGNHLLPILPLVKQAIAFEPQPKVFNKLKRSVEKNKFTNCVVENYGLGLKDEELMFYEDTSGNNGGSSFVKEEASDNYKKIPGLPVKNGDAVLNDLEIQKLDFIKIDVEGFEFEVFKGISNSIKKYSPMILMEWHAQTTGEKFINHDVFNNVLSGYKIFAIEAKFPWWARNKFWSIRGALSRKFLTKFKITNFDYNKNYNNIFLFNKKHEEIVNEMIKLEE